MSRVNLETGLVAVLLLAPCGSLNAGEVAGFVPDEAERLVKTGQASFDLEGSFADEATDTGEASNAAGKQSKA